MASIFGKKTSNDDLGITFGRYSDFFKPPEEVKFWDKAMDFFTQKKYLEVLNSFLCYIRNEKENNLLFTKKEDQLDFEFFQGSKKVSGYGNNEKVVAEVQVAQYDTLSVAFMRKLLEMNYTLNYSRFALKDNVICMKFDSHAVDCSPWKLFYGLKEIATRSDRIDEILIDEFAALKQIDSGHIVKIPDAEKEIKYRYMQKWIKNGLELISGLNPDKFSGGIAYCLLAVCYKIDYLIAPEGTTMDIIERINRVYFAKDKKPVIEKNQSMIKEFEKLINKPKEEIFKDLYRSKSTFGIVNPTTHDEVVAMIDNEMKNVPWYKNNNYPDIVQGIIEYVAGYCLFSFGLPWPTRQLLHLLLQITNQDYFKELGLKAVYYNAESKKIDKGEIKNAITKITKRSTAQFPRLQFDSAKLNFNTLCDFACSYLFEIRKLNFKR